MDMGGSVASFRSTCHHPPSVATSPPPVLATLSAAHTSPEQAVWTACMKGVLIARAAALSSSAHDRALTSPTRGLAAAGMSQSSKKTYNTEALKSRLDQLEAALSEERMLRMKVEQDLYALKSTSLAKPAAE
jgi:hypothetical protein